MRVTHVCLSNFFIDDRAYQENELVAAHARAGHDVLVLASTHVHGADGRRSFTAPGVYRTKEGAKVIRLPYHPVLPHWLAKSLRVHQGVYTLLSEFKPDTIVFHGMCGWELLTAARYHRKHPNVPLFVDNHADCMNSARGPLSRWGLHYLYYRSILLRALPDIERLLCISTLTERFARDFYGVPKEKLEFFPLGGNPLCDRVLSDWRAETRARYGLQSDNVVFVQSGKQSARKYLPELLHAFARVPDERFRLIISGVLMEDIRAKTERQIAADPRVSFIGWRSPDDVVRLLCAADVYLQPGSQSSTMQTSLCCGCAVVLAALPGHERYVSGNGWLIDHPSQLETVFHEISLRTSILSEMGKRSIAFARAHLDYQKLALRVLP